MLSVLRGVGDRTTSHRPHLLEMQRNCYDEPRTTAMCDSLEERKSLAPEGDGSEIRLPRGVQSPSID